MVRPAWPVGQAFEADGRRCLGKRAAARYDGYHPLVGDRYSAGRFTLPEPRRPHREDEVGQGGRYRRARRFAGCCRESCNTSRDGSRGSRRTPDYQLISETRGKTLKQRPASLAEARLGSRFTRASSKLKN